MQALLTTTAIRRPASRRLIIIVEGPYGRHDRLELLVAPGMTVADLDLGEQHSTLVRPGGAVLDAGEDLFEIAADTPRLFALHSVSQRLPQSEPRRPHLPSLARMVYGARL